VLGFTLAQTVPQEEYPAFKGRPIGGTLTLSIEVSNIRASYDELKDRFSLTTM